MSDLVAHRLASSLRERELPCSNQLRVVFFLFCNSRSALLTSRVRQCKWNQPWHTPSCSLVQNYTAVLNIQGLIWLIVSGVLNNYDYRWMVMLDFIYMGSADLFGTGRERKIQNEKMCFQWDSNTHHASPTQENQRLRPLGNADKISNGAFIV